MFSNYIIKSYKVNGKFSSSNELNCFFEKHSIRKQEAGYYNITFPNVEIMNSIGSTYSFLSLTSIIKLSIPKNIIPIKHVNKFCYNNQIAVEINNIV